MKTVDRKREWESQKLSDGICATCNRNPIRKSESGKSRLCESCNKAQVERMQRRREAAREKSRNALATGSDNG